MILATVKSKNNIVIRLTDERLAHITKRHPEISLGDIDKIIDTVSNPYAVLKGDLDENLAISKFGRKVWIVVAYKESDKDGFIVTAYITTDTRWLFKRKMIWIKK